MVAPTIGWAVGPTIVPEYMDEAGWADAAKDPNPRNIAMKSSFAFSTASFF